MKHESCASVSTVVSPGSLDFLSIKERILSISDNPPNMVSFQGVTNLFHPFTACIFVSFHK